MVDAGPHEPIPTLKTVPARARGDDPTNAPGILFYAAILVATLLVLEADSARSMATWLLGGFTWLALGAIWVARFALLLHRRRQPDRRHLHRRDWIRWLGVPAVALLTVLLVRTDLPTRARFELSRGAMNALADEFAAGRPNVRPGVVGLYRVERVEDLGQSFRVIVGGILFEGYGFERFDDPTMTARRANHLCRCHYRDLGGGWFIVVEDF